MKKIVFTFALCLAVGLSSFGQKKAVKSAENEIKSDKPNLADARTSIKGAMSDPETKDDAKTYYVAGMIENKQFDQERTKELLGQQPNEETMYQSLLAIIPYFTQADKLDQLPDAKGKVKPKYRKDIKSIINANRPYYINGGAFYFDKRDYKQAYDFFMIYLDIPKMDMFKGDNIALNDTLYSQIKFYAAVAASQMGEDGRQKAIDMYTSLKSDDYKTNEVYQYLCFEYEQAGDTLNLIATLKEGVDKFPNEPYFLLGLINQYIYANLYDDAVDYLLKAIERKPQDPQLYDVLGRIYENKKEIDKAAEYFEKALQIDPNYVEALGNMGRIYYNKGVDAQAAANDISDNKLYNEEIAKAKEIFKSALPFFEKAHELKPADRDYINALRSIYYNLNMNEQFEKIEKELNTPADTE
ncbi:MAG: tetratricopeptide repeat protein [Dysgonamonadaceae bacterium]|jgi:tetratricopeptide (TPR) repeat protein|nr:tetratricopeptide repeat protein [Dysgonamonadaceae bacterium]